MNQVVISSVTEELGDSYITLSEVRGAYEDTVWSDGMKGESPRDPSATPVENFTQHFELEFTPKVNAPMTTKVVLNYLGSENKESLKEKLMKLIMNF